MRACLCIGSAGHCMVWRWGCVLRLPAPGRGACGAGTALGHGIAGHENPHPALSYKHSSPSPVFLVLTCWGCKDNNKMSRFNTWRSKHGGVTALSLWSGRHPAEQQCGVMSALHVVSVTLSSAFVVWQPPEAGCKWMVWLCFRKTQLNFREFSQVMECHSSDPLPPQLKIGRSFFAQGLYKNRWQTRFGNFITVPPGVPGLWSWLTCWW